jgi:N-glycosylase/DNA lyase
MAYRHLAELRADWRRSRGEINGRLEEFRRLRTATDERMLTELAFCLFAIQTNARRSDAAVVELVKSGLLRQGTLGQVARVLRRHVRFHNHKAAYLVAARERFEGNLGTFRRQLDSLAKAPEAREWLVRDVDGFGYKEASHFLRNIGRGEDLAILDRHVLRNLRRHGVLRSVPDSLSRSRYLEIEEKVRRFARDTRIPMAALDLVFWSRETGEVFK